MEDFMTKAKHTPGPWRIGDEEAELYIEGHAPISTVKRRGKGQWDGLAQVATIIDGNLDATGVANAQLIAAAPELLEALQNFIMTLTEHGEIFPPHVGIAKAAIAKATGKAA
jgi:hypothetical protein